MKRSISYDESSVIPAAKKYMRPVDIQSHHLWTISDAVVLHKTAPKVRLPLQSFNHIAREVLSLEKSRKFYCDILGFCEVDRPPFQCEGYWLYGYGLSLHLVQTTVPEYRRELKRTRIQHFSSCLPQVDHIAFMTSDLTCIRSVLDKAHVYYKMDHPSDGISQIFLFDPDGNVIEVSNCKEHLNPCPLDLAIQHDKAVKESELPPEDEEIGYEICLKQQVADESETESIDARFSDISNLECSSVDDDSN